VNNHHIENVFLLPKLTGNRLPILNIQRPKKRSTIIPYEMKRAVGVILEQVMMCSYVAKRKKNNSSMTKIKKV
jgi:hypothetical protein